MYNVFIFKLYGFFIIGFIVIPCIWQSAPLGVEQYIEPGIRNQWICQSIKIDNNWSIDIRNGWATAETGFCLLIDFHQKSNQ